METSQGLKIEEFIDCSLKPALSRATAKRDEVFEQQKDLHFEGTVDFFDLLFSKQPWTFVFLDLKRNIENLEKNAVTSLRTMVNLGSEVYMQAEVPDTRHICVNIGLGFHVEFTWSEALEFISVKEARLAKQVEEHTREIATIKSHIRMLQDAYRNLLQQAE